MSIYHPDQPVSAAPTCQPSREALAAAVAIHGGSTWADPVSGYVDTILALLPGRSEAEVKAEALEEAATPEIAEWARKLVEDELIELRDARIGMLRNNGLVCAERDGEPSSIIRLGFEMAWQRCLTERAAALRGER